MDKLTINDANALQKVNLSQLQKASLGADTHNVPLMQHQTHGLSPSAAALLVPDSHAREKASMAAPDVASVAGGEDSNTESFSKGDAVKLNAQNLASFNALLANFEQSKTMLLNQMQDDVLWLSQRIAVQLLQRELSISGANLAPLIEDLLPVENQSAYQLHVNPQDFNYLKEMLSSYRADSTADSHDDQPVALIEQLLSSECLRANAEVASGGLSIESAFERIDANIEARIDQLFMHVYQQHQVQH